MSEKLSTISEGYYLSPQEAEFARAAILAQAQQLADRIGGSLPGYTASMPPSAEVLSNAPEPSTESGDDYQYQERRADRTPVGLIHNGQWHEVDLSQWPVDDPIHELVGPRPSEQVAELQPTHHVASTFFESAHSMKQERRSLKRLFGTRQRQIGAAAIGVAALVTGGIVSTGMLSPANSQASAADGRLRSSDFNVGDCFDDSGAGTPLGEVTVAANANMAWNIKTIDGRTVVLKQGEMMPRLTIPDATLEYATCMPGDQKTQAITIDGSNNVTVHLDKIIPEAAIFMNNANSPQSEAWPIQAKAGVTDEKVISALASAMKDKSNTDRAVALAKKQIVDLTNQTPEKIAQVRTAMEQKLKAAVEAEITRLNTGQAVASSPPSVAFDGTWSTLVPKGALPAPSDAFSVTNMNITKFTSKQ